MQLGRDETQDFNQYSSLEEEKLYKILMVDDEEVIRQGLKHTINWKEMGFRIADDVGSVQDALQLIENNHYDVLVTDIQMPQQNGLELISKIRAIYPLMKIVIISGYDSFEYAVSALRYGVEDYLLKPFRPDYVQQVFGKLKKKMDEQRQELNRQQENNLMAVNHFLYHLVQNDYVSKERILTISDQLGIVLPSEGVVVVNFSFHNYAEYVSSAFQGDGGALFQELYNTISNYIELDFDQVSCQIGNNCVFVIPFVQKSHFEELFLKLLQQLGKNCRIGVSTLVKSMDELSIAYYQAIEALHQFPEQSICFYTSKSTVSSPQISQLLLCQKEIVHALECNRPELLEKLTDQVFEILNERDVNYVYNWCLNSVHKIIEYFDIEKIKNVKMNYQFFFTSGLHGNLIKALKTSYVEQLNEIIKVLQKLSNDPNKRLIQKACKMIEEEYSNEDFSMNTIAERLNISYGYLCTIFKQITNENFMDYLLRVRMQNAKCYLLESKYKIYEIADLVGYNSARYFTLVFRKYYGMSPSDYVKKYGGSQ